MAACTPALREALNDTISTGRFADTKITLFSQRDSSGSIRKPRALYASSHVLKTVPYFNDLLFGQFGEAESKDFSEPLDEDVPADDYRYHSDSDLEEDDDSNSSKQNSSAGVHPSDPFCFPPIENEPASTYGKYKEHLEKGKVIKIQDMAFITFQAFLLYLYTGSVKFAPYGSEDNRKSRTTEIKSVSGGSIPRPSPKSIYRLADKYDIPALKRLALDNIKSGLGQCDIVEEIFSKFTSKYDEIRTMQIHHLASVQFGSDEETTKKLCDRIDEKVDAYVVGDLRHAAEAMSLLWEISKKDRHSVQSLQSSTSSTFGMPASSPANWECVKSALIRSIREGIFTDRKYWVRHSREGKTLQPVYFSSIVASGKLSLIDRLVKQCSGRDEFFEKDDRFEDSDCEGGPDQAVGPAEGTEAGENGESGQETLPVLTVGSFASWKALFFYLCVESIGFAPLKSQGLDSRARYIQEEVEREPHAPSPCSPKVVHSLAVALEITPLRDLALKEILSKTTSANIVDEFFSSPTSRRTEIMKMQYELLSNKFDNQDTNASAVDLIKSMADGTRVRHATALKFGLREGFLRTRLTHTARSSSTESISDSWQPRLPPKKKAGRSSKSVFGTPTNNPFGR